MTKDELLLQRRRKGLTQAELATALGYSRQAIIKWERGVHAIPDEIAARIIEACQDSTPKPVKTSTKLIRATVEAYRSMRSQPAANTHADAMLTWNHFGFVPCPEAVAQIIAEYPDASTTNPEK